MTLAFVTNFMNIHQLPLCRAFYNRLGDGFRLIETTKMEPDRIAMKFDEKIKQSYVITAYKSEEDYDSAIQIVRESDVVIIGSSPREYTDQRLITGGLTYKYSERYFKGDNSLVSRIKYWLCSQRHIKPLQNMNLYYLCASAYTAADINRYANYENRALKWGYFRGFEEKNVTSLLNNKNKNSILWVARLIDWKHPEVMVRLAKTLKNSGYFFSLTMVGDGDMYPTIQEMIEIDHLADFVTLLGAKRPEEVRHLMDKSEIFISTSDFNEGWGVVINEAMNSCCGVVASHAIGSVPFLISNGENGLIYKNGVELDLYNKVVRLLIDNELRKKLAINAYRSLLEIWNVDCAAQRLLQISERLLEGKNFNFYERGPCSKARILKNDWFIGEE